MIDSVIESFSDQAGVYAELQKRRDQILEERERLRSACARVIELLDSTDVVELIESMRGERDTTRIIEYLEKTYEVGKGNIKH